MSLPNKERFNEILGRFESLLPILVLGDVGIDKYTYGKVERISPEAPVPVVEVTREWDKLGLAANVSDNLLSLGARSFLCSIIGDDDHGRSLLELMEQGGLTPEGLLQTERRTTFKERIVTDVQQVCRVDYETKKSISDKERESLLHIFKNLLEKSSSVILEDYGKGLFSKSLVQDVISLCRDHGRMVVVDPSRRTDPSYFKGAHLLKPNAIEAKIICEKLGYKEKNEEKIAGILLDKLELDMVIITLGPRGMGSMDQRDGKWRLIPTVANEVYDVSGAGDTAISAITLALMSGASLSEAAWVGNCASGVVVGKKGTARVGREELLKFYGQLAEQDSLREK